MNLERITKDASVLKRSVCMPAEPMSGHTSFRIGGSAELLVCLVVEEGLAEVLCVCRKSRVLRKILGNGSNPLISDKGCKGVITFTEQLSGLRVNGDLLQAGTGQLLGRAAHLALEHSLTGMESATGILGSTDGVLVMNAGVYGSGMKDILRLVRMMAGKGRISDLPAEGLELGYRTSRIPPRGYIMLEAVCELRPGDRGAIKERMRELAARRGEKQPLEYPSAGSTSKRPQEYFAGKFIGDVGLKGYRVGGAQVSEKHYGFVINKDHATANHVMEPCSHIRRTVKEISGVGLEMEIKR